MNGKLVLSGKQTGAANSIAVTGGAAATDLGFAETQRRAELGLLGRHEPTPTGRRT